MLKNDKGVLLLIHYEESLWSRREPEIYDAKERTCILVLFFSHLIILSKLLILNKPQIL